MSQFRSEEMALVQLFIQNDAANDTLHELGHINAIQFKDLNKDRTAFNRIFVQDVRKCDDMLRILRYIGDLMERESLRGPASRSSPVPSLQELHERLQDLEKEMKQHTASYSALLKQLTELREHKHVLQAASHWFVQARGGVTFTAPTDSDLPGNELRSLLDEAEAGGVARTQASRSLGHIAGCIPTENLKDFGLTLFRATRGNLLLKYEDIESPFKDPVTDEEVQKSVFIVFFSGERSRQKVDKICDSYACSKYSLPEGGSQQDEALREVNERMHDLKTVLGRTTDYRMGRLEQIKEHHEAWTTYVMREKAVFHTLNLFNYDVTRKCLIAEGWCPSSQLQDVREALRRGTLKSGSPAQTVLNVVRTKETPPTYFRSTKLTAGFQAIVDAYGIAKYQEMNPAVFAVITFPFLFGVMFGDIGHGIMMTLVAALICAFEKRLASLANDEMFGTVYHGRYNILLMGMFATYAGFIYNEVFSVPMEAFGETAWCSGEREGDHGCLVIPGTDAENGTQKWLRTNMNDAYDFKLDQSKNLEVTWEVYPFGTDPGFAHTANKLNSVNSFKMKFAIIAGVAQMCMGVCCKLMNTLYFKDSLTLLFVFIPEIVFINSIFGYLVILILSKWTTNWDATYVLNNYQVVHIPQVYCDATLSNTPCWTAPFKADRPLVPDYGAELAKLPEHMWCMAGGLATAGCAVFKHNGQLIVESNTYGSKTLMDDAHYSNDLCSKSPEGCVLWKQQPPSLLDSLIKMFMEIGSVPVHNQVVPGQGGLQAFLILVAFISVPMLLLPKPLILKRRHEAKARFAPLGEHGESDDDEGDDGHGGHGGHFDFGEIMVHQMIHTIEYVLGCISNTASYLRLWALSLAHAQLSEVFWEKTVVGIGLEGESPMLLFVCVTAWACFTVGVLMGMESLSAFLHALRLHWVEFMNKFYDGNGVAFIPFGFDNLDRDDE